MVIPVRRIVLWLMSTVTALVLLFGYHTSTSSSAVAQGGNSSVATPVQGGTGTTSGGGAGSSGSSGTASAPADGSTASSTVTGDVAQTRWGPVQVEITVSGGAITDATAVEYPTANGRDQQINAYAIPSLESETVQAQSGDIDMVSGATVTSRGYVASLQDALDQAGL